MKSLHLLSLVSGALLLAGCSTTVYRDGGAANLARPASISSPTYRTDYDVSKERVSATGEAKVVLGMFHFSEGKCCLWDEDLSRTAMDGVADALSPTQLCIGNAKKAAVFNAVAASNADLLLGATYEYTVYSSLFHTQVKCTAKGYPATVKGVKFVNKPVILNQWQRIEYISPDDNPALPCGRDAKDAPKPAINLNLK